MELLRISAQSTLKSTIPSSASRVASKAMNTPRGWIAAALLAGCRGDHQRALVYGARAVKECHSYRSSTRQRAALAAGLGALGQGRCDEAAHYLSLAGPQGIHLFLFFYFFFFFVLLL